MPAAFQARISSLISAVFQPFKVYDFLEWIFVTPVQAVVLTIPPLFYVNALARDGFFSIFPLIVTVDAKTSNEALCIVLWTFLLLPLLFPAPVQFSLTVGVASAEILLLETGVGVGTGSHIGPAGMEVSAFVLFVVVAVAVATFIELEGDASSADDW